MRSMTGRPVLRERTAATSLMGAPEILLPKPPPQYSATSTTSDWSMPRRLARAAWVRAVLWVEACRYSFSFCQYAMTLRGSIG